MRIRSVKPEFWRDRDSTGRWPVDMKLVYVGLWCVADDDGRFEWDLDLLRADLFPFDSNFDLESVMARIVATGKVVSYEVNGRRYGAIPSFKAHQKPNRPSPSRFPPPPERITEPSVSPPVPLTERSLLEKEGRVVGEGVGDGGGGTARGVSPVPRKLEIRARWETAYSLVKAAPYGEPLGPDDEALNELTLSSFDIEELSRRMSNAFADPWFCDRADLALFAKQIKRFAGTLRAKGADPPKQSARGVVGTAADFGAGGEVKL